jgi:thiol-disulfide isomerase/thioredoxin
MPSNTPVDGTATGETAPTVVGEDFDGNEARIENDGRAKAIVFLAHWCPHCQNEVPAVQAWLDSGGGVEGVDMYSVATAMNSTKDNYPSSEWLDREGWTVPVIVDDVDDSVYRAHGAGGFPFWIFENSDGTVAVRVAGSTPIAELEQIMQSLS